MKKPTAQLRPLSGREREYVEQLYNRTQQKVKNHCKAISEGNKAEAEDRFQETYTAVTQSVSKKAGEGEEYELERSTEAAYIKKTAKNLQLNKVSRQPDDISASDLVAEHEDGNEDAESALERAANRDADRNPHAEQEVREHLEQVNKSLNRLLGFLSAEERWMVVLRKIEGRSFDDIAAQMGMDKRYVQWALNGAMSKLRYYGTLEKESDATPLIAIPLLL